VTSIGNALLESLPSEEFDQLRDKMRCIDLTTNQVLSMQGEPVERLYFPTTAFVSCRASGAEGEMIEIYSVGHEGTVEPASILTGVAAVTAEVQIAGQAYEIRIEDLCSILQRTKELPRTLLKYAYSLAVRMVQATRCAMFHTVKQRVVLWLLLAHKSHGAVIPCTHQAIADALGARRASVTVVLNHLEAAGVIGRTRGRITIRSHAGLEGASCDCYRLIKEGLKPELECELGPGMKTA